MQHKKKFVSNSNFPAMSYILTAPKDADFEKENLPLLVFLHGAGERGEDPEILNTVVTISQIFGEEDEYKGIRAITLSPQCPEGLVWNHLVLPLKELIDQIAEEYHVDRDRISITGYSMGGFGVWDMICTYPEMFSAAAPICGGGLSWRVGVLNKLPIRAFHGGADTVVPPVYSETMVETVKMIGGNATLTVYPGVDHGSWKPAYQTSDVIEWLLQQRRK